MSQIESYQVIVLGGDKGGKTLATELGNRGVKAAFTKRSAEMIGGSCINVGLHSTKATLKGLSTRSLYRSMPCHPPQLLIDE